MPVDPLEILREVSPDDVPADAPPAESNYREADLVGVSCAFCSKFRTQGFREADGVMVPVGYCDQWEARVDGLMVSDAYAENTPALDNDGNEVWSEFSDAGGTIEYHEIHLSSTREGQRNGRFTKGILRTGHWPVTPTPLGKLAKPLTIIRDGKSDLVKGIISLSEIVSNFKAKRPMKRVLIPFSDKANDDHIKDGNLAKYNTGFVEDLWIEDEDGVSHLVAEMNFTEPEVAEKAPRGTYGDVSSGVPFHPEFGAFLEHVSITPQPFIDDLRGYLAASDAPTAVQEAEVVHHKLETPGTEEPPAASGEEEEEQEESGEAQADEPVRLSYRKIIERTLAAVRNQFGVAGSGYTVEDADHERVTIAHEASETSWTVPYTVEDDGIKLPPFDQWEQVKDEEESEPPEETPPTPRSDVTPTGDTELDEARELREMRLAASAQQTIIHNGGVPMTVISREELDALPADQRAAIQRVLDENARLTASNREADVDARIEELKGWGFSDRPGFLKLYRQIALSDDGGPAAILLSDDGSSAKERVTARDILDKAIDALKGAEGKVEFSDQHVQPGDDRKPPNSDGPDRSLSERVSDAKSFLHPTAA